MGILFKPTGEHWDTAALFEVLNPDNFHATAKLLSGGGEPNCDFLFGIAPRDADVQTLDIERHTGFFLDASTWDERAQDILWPGKTLKVTLPGMQDEGVQPLQRGLHVF